MSTLTLSQALSQLDISSSAFATVDVRGSWSPDGEGGHATLVIVLGGSGTITVGETKMPMRAGELFLFGSDQRARLNASAPDQALTIACGALGVSLLDGRSIFEFVPMPHAFDAAGSELFNSAIPEMLRESALGGPGSDAIVVCLIRRVVTVLVRDAWPEAYQIPSAKISGQGQQLQKIVDLMNKDPARRYTLDNLAQAAGMSRTVFHRTFTETYGGSPLSLLRKIRLKRAELLLRQTNLPVKTIASRLGYQSRSYFWQAFKEAYGLDPDGYRQSAGVVHVEPSTEKRRHAP